MSGSKTVKQETYRVCGNSECGDFFTLSSEEHQHYCPTCGSPIIDKLRNIEIDKVYPDIVYRKLKGTFYQPSSDGLHQMMENMGVHLWLQNIRTGNCSFIFDPKDETICEEVSTADISRHLEEFGHAFRKEREILEEIYGFENVQVKYGLFNWAS